MPGPTTILKNNLLDHARTAQLLWIGLVDENGVELSGGEAEYEYARVAITWTAPNAQNEIYPVESPVINVPGDTTVLGWRNYTAQTGGSDLGGKNFVSPPTFSGQGTLLLDRDQMGWRFV